MAYANAIAAYAGVNFKGQGGFDYGVDGAFHEVQAVGGRRRETGLSIQCQLKASINWTLSDTEVIYDLEAKNYNDLVERSNKPRVMPLVLGLLCLPKDQSDWLGVAEEQLLLQHCCYWTRLAGNTTSNNVTVRIRIPRTQMLTPGAVTQWFKNVEQGIW